MNILIVEDEFFLAGHMEWLLTEEGYDVVGPVGELSEALQIARREHIDAALLDVSIHGGRTDDVAQILADRKVPFAFISGLGRENLPPKFATSVLVEKPFNDRKLIEIARSLVQPH